MQYILLLITLLILIVNILVGLFRGCWRALIRLGTVVVAAFVAFFLAKGLSTSMSDMLSPLIEQLLASNETVSELFQTQADAAAAVAALAKMLVAPILFLICYIVIKAITLIVHIILCKVLSIKKPKNLLLRFLGGAGVGLVIGLVSVLVFVTPVMGYTDLLSRTVSEVDSISENNATLVEYNEKYITPASKAPVASQLYRGIGRGLFKGLTTAKWNGQKATLENEWFAVVGVIDEAGKLSGVSFVDYGETQSEAVHAMVAGVGESRILSDVGSGLLNSMSNSWLQGGTFVGLEQPKLGDENADVLITGVLRVFSTTTNETLVGDLDAFAQLFDLLLKYDMMDLLAGGNADSAFVEYLVRSGFLAEARALLASNSRMTPVSAAFADMGMRMMISELGLPENYRETYGELMGNMSSALKRAVTDDGQIDAEALGTNLNEIFAEHEVEVPQEAADIIAQGLTDEFTAEELNTLSEEQITDRLIERFSEVDDLEQLVPAE